MGFDKSTITVVLAGPAAARRFDPVAQCPADQPRWRQINSERRRLDWMVSRSLLAGTAALPGRVASLSHSNGYAAAAITSAPQRLGVDLEFIRPRDVVSLAKLAFPDQESAYIESLTGRARLRHFYALWTVKEAVAKALQLGLHATLRGCSIVTGADGWHASGPTGEPWYAQVFAPAESLVLAIVWHSPATAPGAERTVLQREWPRNGCRSWQRIAHIRPQSA